MRYWWVNQNQTFRAEVRGSFMWSPKRNANGARNRFYENMRAARDNQSCDGKAASSPLLRLRVKDTLSKAQLVSS